SGLDSDTNVTRTTEAIVGQGQDDVTARQAAIDAAGDVTVAAANTGAVVNVVDSSAIGSVTNVAVETTKALVRGVTVAAGGLAVSADSDTTYYATSLDAENRVGGTISAA